MKRILTGLFAAALLGVCFSCRSSTEGEAWGRWPAEAEGAEGRAASLAMAISELRALGQADRAHRAAIAASATPEGPDPTLLHELAAFRRQSSTRLEAIVTHFGWPTRSRFGEEAAREAWWILLHADHAPRLQAQWLPVLERLAEEGEADPAHAALLSDRVAVAQGRAQRYGSQMTLTYDSRGYRFVPATPIAEPEGLDARRAAVGLEPHAEYLADLTARMAPAGDAAP